MEPLAAAVRAHAGVAFGHRRLVCLADGRKAVPALGRDARLSLRLAARKGGGACEQSPESPLPQNAKQHVCTAHGAGHCHAHRFWRISASRSMSFRICFCVRVVVGCVCMYVVRGRTDEQWQRRGGWHSTPEATPGPRASPRLPAQGQGYHHPCAAAVPRLAPPAGRAASSAALPPRCHCRSCLQEQWSRRGSVSCGHSATALAREQQRDSGSPATQPARPHPHCFPPPLSLMAEARPHWGSEWENAVAVS